MKSMKRLGGFLMAAVMLLGFGVTALADSTYTLTITGGKTGHTYEAYQIFTGTLYEDTANDKTVLSDIEWGDGINDVDFLSALQGSASLGSAFADCDTAAKVAKVLSDHNTDKSFAETFAQLASENLSSTVAGTGTESPAGTYTIGGLKAGYYLIKDQDGSVTAKDDAYTDIILEVVKDTNATVKAVYPGVEKEADIEDAGIGDTVTYTLTGTVPDTSAYTSYTYIFHDTLSAGLTVDEDSFEVTKEGESTPLLTGTDYTLVVGTYNSSTGTPITITMLDAKNLSGKEITVTYEAEVNEHAVIGNDGNLNTVYVEYSNNPNGSGTGTTTEEKVVTFTFELDVTKVDKDNPAKTLEGAQFVLYKMVNGSPSYVQIDAASQKVTGWTGVEGQASTLSSDSSGSFSVIGLDVGTYYLKETKAPNGYNKLSAPVTLVIAAVYEDTDNDGLDEVSSLTVQVGTDAAVESADSDKSSVDISVENSTGSTLPGTGGIGSTIFYLTGSILILGAAALLFIKKRAK
ncbi:MAG: SpaH/EbpB family LPXTG-anchored major pilin [Lachnospiraceae bacterium]|nr:SpaH/EbpB family LPXTG-anchored major pilin [Lachnospiraceae bacterium]